VNREKDEELEAGSSVYSMSLWLRYVPLCFWRSKTTERTDKFTGKVVLELKRSTTPGICIFCLIKHHNMKSFWGSGDTAPRTFNRGTRWKWVVRFTLRQLYPWGKEVDPRAGLDAVAKIKKSHHCSCRNSNTTTHLDYSRVCTPNELPWLSILVH
jgi:hypothetical protein